MKIITTLAKKEFGDSIGDCNNYLSLKKDIMKSLRKLNFDELEENRLNTLVGIEHLKENDFGNFISVRFAYWGMLIALVVMLIGDNPIYNYFKMSGKMFGYIILIMLIFILYTMSRTIHVQHDHMEYLNFKLICFDELLGNKRKIK